ncbi:hypothetical protein FGIG_11596 [Fasciola gigantica]|uniref:Uncharacterized protein n=1 Tax=Fasciola gigantica TaxID=46835 RepID=A0A504YQZ1_FASGI|nr:hypothetical protein FGIG_11596 [Fasciola gigantica]
MHYTGILCSLIASRESRWAEEAEAWTLMGRRPSSKTEEADHGTRELIKRHCLDSDPTISVIRTAGCTRAIQSDKTRLQLSLLRDTALTEVPRGFSNKGFLVRPAESTEVMADRWPYLPGKPFEEATNSQADITIGRDLPKFTGYQTKGLKKARRHLLIPPYSIGATLITKYRYSKSLRVPPRFN